jgi:hypothetical protein
MAWRMGSRIVWLGFTLKRPVRAMSRRGPPLADRDAALIGEKTVISEQPIRLRAGTRLLKQRSVYKRLMNKGDND